MKDIVVCSTVNDWKVNYKRFNKTYLSALFEKQAKQTCHDRLFEKVILARITDLFIFSREILCREVSGNENPINHDHQNEWEKCNSFWCRLCEKWTVL